MSEKLENVTAALIAAAKKAGATDADALAVSSSAISVDVLNGALEHAERAESTEVGLRVLLGQRQACVSASATDSATLSEMAERAIAMAREAPVDTSVGLADPGVLATDWDIDALELADVRAEVAPQDLEAAALEAEAAALEIKGVSQVQGSSAGSSRHEIHLSATNGFQGGYVRTGHSVSCVAISGEGLSMEREYSGESRTFRADLPGPAEIGSLAGERAVARMNPTRPPTGAFPVLFDERISSSLIGHLLAAVNGASIVRGSSWLRDALGQSVLPADISLVEDPRRPRISASRPFDAEGLPTARRVIVRDGALTGWTLDLATGRRLGMESTANAARGTSSPPSPSSGNMALLANGVKRADLIADMGTGLIITSLIGASINPNTGDYSRGASGFWVENGEVTGPVNECTVAGNLRDMLKSIRPADDARPHLSRLVPSLLVEGLTIAGA